MSRIRTMFVAAALVLLVALIGLSAGGSGANAQTLPPRPTDVPVTPTLTATPKPKRKTHPTAVPTGRIAGTVIDQSTGAPVPGVNVSLNDTLLTTDSNGNYDLSALPADSYVVTLLPAAGFGAPALPPIVLELADGGTVIQHLFFLPRAAAHPTVTP